MRGTSDFYPPQISSFEHIVDTAKKIFKNFGYNCLILPHLEDEGLFRRSVGDVSDIVQKQMFKLEGKCIVLRPEGTAGAARFYIENNLDKAGSLHKFYYSGSMFRGERPQRGRLREFHHVGAEAFGSDNFYLDAEVIDVAFRIINALNIKDVTLKINSLGCLKDKEALGILIKDRLSSRIANLCQECQRRFSQNPLRILDCKEAACRKVVGSLSIKNEYLCVRCREHFSNLLALLDELGIPYSYQPLLVSGLDYYTNTVFEFTTSRLGAQDALGAGGRYNNLVKKLGGPDVPAVGFALGVERMLLLLAGDYTPRLDVYVAYTSGAVYKEAYKIARLLRDNAIPAAIDYSDKSLKGQLRNAQKLGAVFSVIVGDEELKDSCIIMRNMRESIQEKIKIDAILEWINKQGLTSV
ncbi:MAG: histidine--tRNA ligase [Candidatus Omnitrophota bacterium]